MLKLKLKLKYYVWQHGGAVGRFASCLVHVHGTVGFLWVRWFSSTFQKHVDRRIGISKLPLGVNVCAWCPGKDCHSIQGVFPLHCQCSWDRLCRILTG